MRYLVLVLLFSILASAASEPVFTAPAPRRRVDEQAFASIDELVEINKHVGGAGLRGTASSKQNDLIEWLSGQLGQLPGMRLEHLSFNLTRWEPQNDSLAEAASLKLSHPNSCPAREEVRVAAAVPYTRQTNGKPVTGQLLHVAYGQNISAVDARNKIIIRDVGWEPTPYSMLFAISNYRSNDTASLRLENYSRPYTAGFDQDILGATSAGAVGIIFAWNVSHKYVQSYFDPHQGTMYKIPGVSVGSQAAQLLKDAASQGLEAELDVRGKMSLASTREIYATLPGMTAERAIVTSHTDGNTWIQDNGVSAVLSLARYFAAQPRAARNKTLQFIFTSSHLHYSTDGNFALAERLNREYDSGNISFVFPLEHMGAREILPVPSRDGGGFGFGHDLEYTGKGEMTLWAVGPSDALREAVIDAVQHRQLDRVAVLPGIGLPDSNRIPEYTSFGGIGTSYHDWLIPTAAVVSGPWSLWAPYFGAGAVDFHRLRQQILAAGDVLLSVDGLSREQIAGGYLKYRKERAAGKAVFTQQVPPQFAP